MCDFKSLSARDFEVLARDLMQAHLGVFLESFKTGRDKGIDLRYSPTNDRALIVQCKHYAESGIKALMKALKEELLKVDLLAPKRYLLVTSVPLTPTHKDAIVEHLRPHCAGPEDVYGNDELNNLLTQHPEIERAHFKLWLTSVEVLKRVLHSSLYEQSRLTVEQIKSKLRLYVQNSSYNEAKAVLTSDHYCIISGVPGIGKTFLAEILLIDHINRGYEPFVITSNISEAYAVLRDDALQVFYYDDFLGQTGLEDKLDKNEDASLLRFINYIKGRKGARFILTTREYILQAAKQFYERLESSDFDYAKCVIDLEQYTRVNRAQILYNHLYFSSLPEPYVAALCTRKTLLKIVDHPNYSPRIVEWMCRTDHRRDCSPQEYPNTFLSVLAHPIQLWRYAYDKHISPASRCALLVLASARCAMRLEDLQEAFRAVAHVTATRYGAVFPEDSCTNALRELEGSFIRIEQRDRVSTVGFHNPSVLDFLESHLAENRQVLRDLCEGAVFYEQFKGLCLLHDGKPDHDHMAQFSAQDPELLRNCLVRTVERPLQTMHLIRDGCGKSSVVTGSLGSVDANILHALRSLIHVDDDLARVTANDLLTIYCQRLAAHTADVWYAPEVVSAARTLNADSTLIGALMADAVLVLREYLHDYAASATYELLCGMDEEFGPDLPKDVIDSAVLTLSEDAESIFDDDISSATSESELDALKTRATRIENCLGVRMYPIIERIEEQIEEIRRNEPDEPDDLDDDYRPSISGTANDSDDMIVDMFCTLQDRYLSS